MINIIVLSLALGTIGFLIIDKNFNLALDSQIKTTIEDNNLIQSMVEYECLGKTNIRNSLPQIGEDLASNMYINETALYIIYDNVILFTNATSPCPESLLTQAEIGKKNYIITEEDGGMYIYASSCNQVVNKNLQIVNRRDITAVYQLVEQQKQYFNILLVAVILTCSVFMYIISRLLTRPLESLQKVSENFAKGDYTSRAIVKSSDEVGDLADTYNHMATAVSQHIDELQDMVIRQEQFVSDFTHEIKTPMTSIIGYSDTIRSLDLSREEQIMAASYIFNEGKRLEAMSMKLFDFIYTKHHQIDFKDINSSGLMHSVKESIEPSLNKASIILKIETEPCIIKGDKDLLKSAFINLIDNARKASSAGKTIIFSGKIVDDTYVISVQDFGIGIEEEHLNKICDEFYMVDKSRSRKEGGAGLGLSLAALIFKSHNAIFNIKSTLGEGTTITVTFKHIGQPKEGDYEEI